MTLPKTHLETIWYSKSLSIVYVTMVTHAYPLSNEKSSMIVGFPLFRKALIQRGGCDVQSLGRNSATPLHLAAEMDNDAICKILVRFSITFIIFVLFKIL